MRDWLSTIKGFKSVSVVLRPANLGLAKSIIGGVTELVERHGRVIVLEDDMVTSRYFLRYMNETLDLYEDQEEVASIHGYTYPLGQAMPDTFFLRGADCWGWATWRRAWSLFEADGQKLLAEIRRRELSHAFDYEGAVGNTEMLQMQIEGRNNSWAIRWHASAFLAGKLTLYPGKSLVCNIGNDGSGEHCGVTDRYRVRPSHTPVRVQRIETKENSAACKAWARFHRRGRGWRGRMNGLLCRIRQRLGMSGL